MNSTLKPVLPQTGGPASGGQSSPAKANVANANHSVGHPQGAQNSLQVGSNSMVGQNLVHHPPSAPQLLPHAVPSMAPISANMAQMAQNMSHHGNLSPSTQNSTAPVNPTPSPSKPPTPNKPAGPISLVADKVTPSQPLALTRTPEKKEPDSTGQSNGTMESPKSASNAPTSLKPQNIEQNKDKQDIAKTSPSTPKPPEKPSSTPNTPQKAEPASQVNQVDGPSQPKVATANEPPEKSPSKPVEPKPAPTADIAPTQSNSKPIPESANASLCHEKASQNLPSPQKPASSPPKPTPSPQKLTPTTQKPAPLNQKATTPQKPSTLANENTKIEVVQKVEEKKVDTSTSKPAEKADNTTEKSQEVMDETKEDNTELKKEELCEKLDKIEKIEKTEENLEEKKSEEKVETPGKPPVRTDTKSASKSTLKLATVTTPMRKRRMASPNKDTPMPAKKSVDSPVTDTRSKRNRTQVQLYQSPTPELTMATKLSASAGRSTPTKQNDDKLIVFYKNEYLAVRNAEGGFYVCQAMQNVYRTTRKIKIRWLSQDKTADASGETYKPDFYDTTDMECVLTTLSLSRAGGGAQRLSASETARAASILARALAAEQGRADPPLTAEHPDGLDLSLYTDESQLDKKSRKRSGSKGSPGEGKETDDEEDATDEQTPTKKARTASKRTPRSASKSKTPAKNNKKQAAGSTPNMAPATKTATPVVEKAKPKATPKKTPAKPAPKPDTPATTSTPTRQGRRAAAKERAVPTPPPSSRSRKAPTQK